MHFSIYGAVSIVAEVLFVYFVVGRIFIKAGYSRFECLLLLVPLLNIIEIVWFASTDWPLERELRRLKNPKRNAELSAIVDSWSAPSPALNYTALSDYVPTLAPDVIPNRSERAVRNLLLCRGRRTAGSSPTLRAGSE